MKMPRHIFFAAGLSTMLGAHISVGWVPPVILPHYINPITTEPKTRAYHVGLGLGSTNRWIMRSASTAASSPVAASGQPSDDPHTLPKDETFNLLGILREIIAAPVPPVNSKRYDGVGNETGGIWRSRMMGFLPTTVVASPVADDWITKQETAGNTIPCYPESLVQLIGPKALISTLLPTKKHVAMMRVYDQALSPKSTVALIPIMETALHKRVVRWEECAASGQEVKLFDDIKAFTLETISRAIFRDYATDAIISDILQILPEHAAGVISIPQSFPWPLSCFPIFSFGRSMIARQEFVSLLRGVLRTMKEEVESKPSMGSEGNQRRNAGIVGTFLDMQAQQRNAGGSGEGEVEIDDDFIIDNVIGLLFAGWKTTSSVISRMVQLIRSVECKDIFEQLTEEISRGVVDSDKDTLEQGSFARSSSGILSRLPVTEATFLEATRLYPSAPAVFRKVINETSYNGYRIPAGEKIQWSTTHGCRSESLYPNSSRFCPFRFLNRGSDGSYTLANGHDAEQPLPRPFGFGVRMCRGRELAKLEAFMFLRALLTNFDYELVEGQIFKGNVPMNEPKDSLRVVLKSKARSERVD